MTWLAVIVVPLASIPKSTIPRTRTLSPFVMALTEIAPVPFWYVVESAFSIVAFRPADVEITKLDVDTS
jgi:hypothetical protein